MSSIFTIGGKTVQDITIGAKQVQSIYDNTNQVLLWEKPEPNYFYFEDRSGEANSISITKTGDQAEWLSLEYSTDKETWSTWDFAQTLTLPANSKVYLRGDNTYGFGMDNVNYHTFNCTGNYALGGNIWSVMSDNVSSIPPRFGSRTFQNSTTLVDCSQLSIPNLPVHSVPFTWMFAGCTNLTSVMDSIPVTYSSQDQSGANSEFYQMFIRNANQLNFPRFPNVTRLSKQGMHQILVQTTSAANNALNYVDLSSIETVINQSLNQAFLHCQALEVVKIGISEWGTYDDSEAYNYRSTYQWLGDVHSTGVFCKNATLPVTRGINYIPDNWSIADLNGKLYAPVIAFVDNNTISITEAEGGASSQIFYTVDGTIPTPQNGTLYTQPFTVGSNVTVKAIAHYNGNRADLITDSDVVTVSDIPSPTPTLEDAGSVKGIGDCPNQARHYWIANIKTPNNEGVTYYLNWKNSASDNDYPSDPTTEDYDITASYNGKIGTVEADSEAVVSIWMCDSDMVGQYVNIKVIGVRNGYVSDISTLSMYNTYIG